MLRSSACLIVFWRQVGAIAVDLLDKARKTKVPVTRDVLRSFGRSARTTLLADTATSAAVSERVGDFKAGEKWAKDFVERNNIHSVRLHGEAGNVDKAAIKGGYGRNQDSLREVPG